MGLGGKLHSKYFFPLNWSTQSIGYEKGVTIKGDLKIVSSSLVINLWNLYLSTLRRLKFLINIYGGMQGMRSRFPTVCNRVWVVFSTMFLVKLDPQGNRSGEWCENRIEIENNGSVQGDLFR